MYGPPGRTDLQSAARAGKGWLYEGGIREPTIICAPGVTRAGSTCDQPIVSMDFFPTLLDLAGIDRRPDLHTDGVSLVPLLADSGPIAPRAFYWHYPHYHGSTWTPGAAIRVGNWKLIEFYHWQKVELYNLQDDPGERSDLSQQRPQLTSELRSPVAKVANRNRSPHAGVGPQLRSLDALARTGTRRHGRARLLRARSGPI